MPVINFNINPMLDKKIKKFIHEEGLSSKAEFFRFAAFSFMGNPIHELPTKERIKFLVAELEEVVHRKLAGKKLPSIEEQLHY